MSSPRDDARRQIRDALTSTMIDKIRTDKYPSTTMMDALEATIDDEHRLEYADALLAKVEGDQFPSIDLMRRLSRLAG